MIIDLYNWNVQIKLIEKTKTINYWEKYNLLREKGNAVNTVGSTP